MYLSVGARAFGRERRLQERREPVADEVGSEKQRSENDDEVSTSIARSTTYYNVRSIFKHLKRMFIFFGSRAADIEIDCIA